VTLSKQEVIDKILSFNYEELANWIRSRLQGDDRYFPVYEGYEPNLSEFLAEAFQHIKNETFRENFLEILGDLTTELWGFTRGKKKIEENKDYIYELLTLCGSIKKFKNKNTLYRIARSGKLRGLKGHGLELHQLLLTTLASYHVAGDYHFWIEQMNDHSNKYYANAAFYALLNRKYDLDIVFKHIVTFIDRFRGEINLVWGIRALINKYGKEEVSEKFRQIESKLSQDQKEAVNNAFIKADYTAIYKPAAAAEYELKYKPSDQLMQKISEPTPRYETTLTLQDKVGEIFERMGFEVEFNCQMAGYSIDIFIKKKKTFGDKYECYICHCHEGEQRVNKDEVNHLLAVREAVDGCDAIIISKKGFTKDAVEMAGEHGIELKTLHDLEDDLKNFYSHMEKFTQEKR
jgi:hypothetical protein